MPTQPSFTETRIAMSDPTTLGVFGLFMVTFVAASQKMGWTSGVAYLIPWALFLGSIAQVWASFVDFKKNNYFGAIVLGAPTGCSESRSRCTGRPAWAGSGCG